MSLAGQLSTMPLGDLLQWVHLGAKTGTLQVDGPGFRKLIYFRDGRVLFASSTREQEKLGEFLVRRRDLNRDQLEDGLRIWREQRGIMKLSEILVGRGYMTSQEMSRRVAQLVEQILYDLFLYREGTFSFDEGHLPAQVTTSFQLDSQWLALEGLRRLDEYHRNASQLPAADQVLVPLGADESQLEELGAEAAVLYQYLDGERDVAMALEASPLSAFEAQAGLLKLLRHQLVAPVALSLEQRRERKIEAAAREAERLLAEENPVAARRLLRGLGELREESVELERLERSVDEVIAKEVLSRCGGEEGSLRADPDLLRGKRHEDLTGDEGFVLSRIGEQARVREVFLTSGLSRGETMELILRLLQRKIVMAGETGRDIEPMGPR